MRKNLKTQARCLRPARLWVFFIWGQAAVAAWLNQSQVTNAVANQALTQLVSNQTLPAAQQKQLFSTGLKALFAELTPMIQAMPDYTGQFVANCSIFMNTHIERVLCEINSTIALGRPECCGQSSWLPLEYEHQITESAILLVSFYADWTGKTSLSSESYAVRLFDRMPTCTASASVSQTKPTLSQTFSKASSRNTVSLLDTLSLSFTEGLSPSQKRTRTLSDVESATRSSSRTLSASETSGSLSYSQTLSPTESPSAPVIWNPEWANWQVTTGVYRDNANQTGRYLESVPGVITDRMTGLQWQKVGSAPASNWTAAQAYCADLLESGFEDWRLPTHVELQTLVDYTMDCAGPSLDLNFFPGTQTSSYYWSSDALQGYPGSAWWVSYGSGAYGAGLVCSQGYGGCSSVPASGFTRCVRPLSAVREVDRYTFNSTQVLDTVTGLIWQRTVSGTYNWSSAQAYCAGLNLDGLPWRLPNVKELSTLLDIHVAYPGSTINTTAFPSTPQNIFWTSMLYSCAPSSGAWGVDFGYGSVGTYLISVTYCVRCVRSPQVYNPEWANWQVTTGVYRDNANQTGRYLESVPGIVTDQMTSLQWQKVGNAPAGNWTAAQAYCANLFESGFGDWRLPTHVELQTLVDYTIDCAGPSVDLDFFPGTQTSSYYWSSDALQGYPGSAWWVSYGSGAYYAGLVCSQGYSGCSSVPANGFTRCVRPSSAVREVDRYTFNSTQVLDTVTGLIWQRTVSGTYNWSSAQAYCASLNLDGLSWRLPNVKELSTLLDVRVAYPGPTINTTAFPSTPQSWFWTSTPYSCTPPSVAWSVNFGGGSVNTYGISSANYVRCVR